MNDTTDPYGLEEPREFFAGLKRRFGTRRFLFHLIDEIRLADVSGLLSVSKIERRDFLRDALVIDGFGEKYIRRYEDVGGGRFTDWDPFLFLHDSAPIAEWLHQRPSHQQALEFNEFWATVRRELKDHPEAVGALPDDGRFMTPAELVGILIRVLAELKREKDQENETSLSIP